MNLQDAMVPEELWESIEPLLPPEKLPGTRGRPPIANRNCLAGIMYLLKTGCQYRFLPCQELGCGSPATVWRRLDEWSTLEVWPKLHDRILQWCGALGELDPKHVVIDSASIRAFFGGRTPAQIPQIGRKKAANAM
jgi:transposase